MAFLNSFLVILDYLISCAVCIKGIFQGLPIVAQRKRTQLVSKRMQIQSLALLSELRIWHCRELWCSLQTWLRSDVAVASAGTAVALIHWIPSLGTSTCRKHSPEKCKKRKIWSSRRGAEVNEPD